MSPAVSFQRRNAELSFMSLSPVTSPPPVDNMFSNFRLGTSASSSSSSSNTHPRRFSNRARASQLELLGSLPMPISRLRAIDPSERFLARLNLGHNDSGEANAAHRHYIERRLHEPAVDVSELDIELDHDILHFESVPGDYDSYSFATGVEKVLRNDQSVYCIRHHGTINILLKYCGWAASGIACDINCVISQVIIKLSSHGHRTSCKEGMIFVSHDPIDVETTQIFDRFTKEDWESYIDCYFDAGDPDDADDPIAWFRIPSREREAVIHLNHRAGKYVLIKLLQTDAVYEKIDLQYIGFIGYSGARAFASARLC